MPHTDAHQWQGRTMFSSDDEKLGKISEIYEDPQTGKPEWATVNTGLFGTKSNFVPLVGASENGVDVWAQVTKAQVKDAPGVEADGELSEHEEQELFAHYNLPYTQEGSTTAQGQPNGGGARLRKYVVTEMVTKTVPVQREEVRIEREPITDANRDQATSGADISEEEHDVVLHEDAVVVDKQAVAKERVRMAPRR